MANSPHLDKILAAARKMAEGDYTVEVNAAGENEDIAALADTMNQIARRFQEQAKTCKELQHNLDKITERNRRWIANFPGVVYMIRVTPDGGYRFPYVSENAFDVLGIHAEDIMRQPSLLSGARHPDDAKAMDKEIQRCYETSQPFRFEVRHLVRGEYRWFQCFSRPELQSDGKVLMDGIGVMLDITEHKKAAEALQASEMQFRRMAEQLEDVLFITDDGGAITYVSPSSELMLGWRPEEIIGRQFVEFLPQDQIAIAMEQFQAAMSVGRPARNMEMVVNHKSGKTFLADLNGAVIREGQRITGTIGLIRDITERKRLEEAIRESEERYRLISEQSSDMIWTAGIDLKFTFLTPSVLRVRGYTVEEALEQTIAEYLTPSSLQTILDAFREELDLEASGKADSARVRLIEAEIYRKDGSTLWTESSISFLHDKDGKLVGFQGATRDISERKRAEEEKKRLQEQLQQAMKMEAVGRLAGGVAHDFNNLLTGITGYLSLALMDLDPFNPLSAMLTDVQKAAESAVSLTRQLLAFSRKQIVEPRILNLNDLLDNTHKLLIRLIGEDIHLETIPGVHLGSVKVDPGQFEQILVNLAVNARDAMPDGGKLIIETANVDLGADYCARHAHVNPGPFVMLAVSDTGHGMSKKVKDHLFEPFFTTKPKEQGTGLGLATIYGTVKQAGGSIEVYSEVGQGTAFKIYLPRVKEKAEKLQKEVRKQELPEGNETVLLVEDEGIVRDLAILILKRLGYNVLSAPNGGVAFMLAEKHKERIDLLMTDVVLPGINGRQLAERLVKIHPEMKVLFTSGYTENVIVHHGVVEETLNFIGKPYSPPALAMKIRDVLDSKKG